MFVKTIVLSYLFLVIYGLIQKIEFITIEEEIEQDKEPITLQNFYNHPITIASGLKNPYVLVEAEEEHPSWSIEYFEDENKESNFKTTIIEIKENEQQEHYLLIE